jgi:hypothetical protein
VFADVDSEVIDYGHRWGSESPPSESYSVVSNLERFTPLHRIADALVDHLTAVYDVEVSTASADAAGVRHDPDRALRYVTLTPHDVDAAQVTIVYTAFPGVILSAGMLFQSSYPVCGCDACDESWDGLASDLESGILSIVAGLYREEAAAGSPPTIGYQFGSIDADSYSASRGPASDEDLDRLRSRGIIPPWSKQWRAWPRRPA